MPTRVIIVEDDEPVARLIAQVLASQGFDLCGTAGTGEDGVALACREQPDVALVDLGLPKMSGEDVIATLKQELPRTTCIALTSVDIPARVLAAMQAGAAGYILKPFHASELARSIEEVLSGDAPTISPRAAKALLQALGGDPPDRRAKDGPALSKRELEVLQLLVHGHTYADVARALGIGEGTVRKFVERIYEKLIYEKLDRETEPDTPDIVKQLVSMCKVGMVVTLLFLVLLALCRSR